MKKLCTLLLLMGALASASREDFIQVATTKALPDAHSLLAQFQQPQFVDYYQDHKYLYDEMVRHLQESVNELQTRVANITTNPSLYDRAFAQHEFTTLEDLVAYLDNHVNQKLFNTTLLKVSLEWLVAILAEDFEL